MDSRAVTFYFHGGMQHWDDFSTIYLFEIMCFVLLSNFFFLGENAAPHLNSDVSAAKVSVKLPSMNTDNQTQSVSSICGDPDSSGTDTF